MKELLALVAIVLSVLVIYTIHQDRVKKAAAEASPVGMPGSAYGPARKAKALSAILDPYHVELFAPVNYRDPADLVPPLRIIKQRTTDKRKALEPDKLAMCDAGLRCLDLMIATAEERTQMLDAALRIAARPSSPLDTENTGTKANTFFRQTLMKRWEDNVRQRKPAIAQAMAQLRRAEGEWTAAHDENSPPADFFAGNLPPVYVRIEDADESENPLGRGAYGQQRLWRRSYYEQYNQGAVPTY